MLRALIVDDERPARKKMARFLAEEPDIAVVGEAGDGPSALAAIRELAPDLVFLDVQMPGMNGFEALQRLPESQRPRIVFATAYDQYALRAFDAAALDYLLKPFDQDRFRQTLARVREWFGPRADESALRDKLGTLLDGLGLGAKPDYAARLLVKARGRTLFLDVGEVDWFQAAANYVELHVGDTVHLMRETLRDLETRLDPARFARIHRGCIVNLDRVAELQPWSKNDWLLILKDGRQLKLSRRYRHRLPGCLEG